jgi:hypothetical protein
MVNTHPADARVGCASNPENPPLVILRTWVLGRRLGDIVGRWLARVHAASHFLRRFQRSLDPAADRGTGRGTNAVRGNAPCDALRPSARPWSWARTARIGRHGFSRRSGSISPRMPPRTKPTRAWSPPGAHAARSGGGAPPARPPTVSPGHSGFRVASRVGGVVLARLSTHD